MPCWGRCNQHRLSICRCFFFNHNYVSLPFGVLDFTYEVGLQKFISLFINDNLLVWGEVSLLLFYWFLKGSTLSLCTTTYSSIPDISLGDQANTSVYSWRSWMTCCLISNGIAMPMFNFLDGSLITHSNYILGRSSFWFHVFFLERFYFKKSFFLNQLDDGHNSLDVATLGQCCNIPLTSADHFLPHLLYMGSGTSSSCELLK